MRFGPEEPHDGDRGSSGGQSEESPQSMSLLGGIAGGEEMSDEELEAMEAGGGGGLLNQGTILMLIVALVAAGSLYGMRVSQGDISSEKLSAEVEQRIAQVLAKIENPDKLDASNPLRQENLQSLFEDTDSIVAMFAEDPTQAQVPIEFVKKNPFEMGLPRPVVEEEQAGPSLDERRRELRRRALESELSRYELQTVMQGRSPRAIINNELVQVGHEVGSFKVVRISDLRVDLEADDMQFRLEMRQPGDAGSQRPRR